MFRNLLIKLICLFYLFGCTNQDAPEVVGEGRSLAGGNSGSEGSFICEEKTRTLSSLNEVANEVGFSAQELFDTVGTTHEVAFRWETQDSEPSIEPGQGLLSLSIEPASDSATVYFCDNPDFSEEWSPSLHIPVVLSLQDQASMLDERFDAELITEERDRAQIEIRVDPDELKGTLGSLVGDFYTAERRPVDFKMMFTDRGPKGLIMGPFSPHAANPCRSTVYAVWPTDSECWFAAEEEQIDLDTLQTYLDRVNGIYELEFDDQGTIEANIQVRLEGDTTCLEETNVYHRIELQVVAEEAQIDLSLPGWMYASPSVYEGQPDEIDVSSNIALNAAGIYEKLGYEKGPQAAIVEVYLHSPVSRESTDVKGKLEAVEIVRDGFDSPLPMVELPGGDSQRCFDTDGINRAPFIHGSLVEKK